MIELIDRFLNKITMYRLVLYYLLILIAIAAIFGAFGILPYNPVAIIFSFIFLTAVAWVANGILAHIFKAQPNVESVYITAFILALIITPGMPTDVHTLSFLAWAAIFAMASKYVLAIDKKHVFNPAAFAVAITALTIHQSASWWACGNLPLLPFVVTGGLLVLRKVQRFDLAGAFLLGAAFSILAVRSFNDPVSAIQKVILHTPLFFFAAIMITEPLTTPPTRFWRVIYGAIVGLLFAPQVHIASLYSTPELALLAGNIFSFAVSPKGKHVLKLEAKNKVSDGIYDFVFASEKPMRFQPGQYMEWTLSHVKSDTRGNRRYFTVASSPTEDKVRLGVRFYEPSSTFKKALLAMSPGESVVAGQLAGDFTLPRDTNKKLVFIAGGIGITPFRSMIKYLSDRNEKRDAVLLYSNWKAGEAAYREVFDEAKKKIGIRTIYAATDRGEKIDGAFIQKEIPDYRDRMFYISGSYGMTSAFKKTLTEIGVPQTHIRTDFFPGFA